MAESSGPRITCEKVSLVIGKNRILSDIDLTVSSGEIHCIIGPNGGGKSSLVNTLLGGTRHGGTVSMHWTGPERTIGYVPQSIAIDKTMPLTVRDFLTLCVQNRPAAFGLAKRAAKRVDAVLADVKMTGKEKLLFSELSGGERQRVLFAQALIPTPRLLILDEPLANIDSDGAEIIAGAVKSLAQSGTTVVWVNHDIALVRALANTVTCINRRVLFSGAPSDVLDQTHLFEIFAAPVGA